MALAFALVTKEQVQDQIGGTFSTAEDTTIDLMIDSVTLFAEKYIGRFIKGRGSDITEEQDVPTATNEIYIRNFPIISLTSFTFDGTLLVEGEDDDFFQYNDIGLLAKTTGRFQAGRKQAVIVYQGGYVTVPEDLQNWAIQVVVLMFQNRNSKNIKQERVGEISVTYTSGVLAENPDLKATLDQYKANQIASWV